MEGLFEITKIQFKKPLTAVAMMGIVAMIGHSPAFADPTPTYTASLSTSGGVAVNVSSAGNGANVSTDTVNVVSTCPSGYTLAIGGPSDATLYLNGNSSATSTISASTGTSSNPVPIIGSGYTNTWGYSTAANTTTNSNFIGLTNTPSIVTTTSAASASGGDNISVYYGASVDGSIKPGTYMMAESSPGAGDNAIVYYLTTSQDCVSYMVHFDPTSTATGSSVSGTGTMSDQRIFENMATSLTSNGFTAPSGYVFKGWNTAQDGTGTSYADGASVTNLTTVGQTITLYAQWKEVCPSGYICYNENGDNVVGTMGQDTVAASATSKGLIASNFSREGYGFAGWSDVEDYITNSDAHFYGPEEKITFAAGAYTSPNYGLDLYAVWIASEGYLQDSAKLATLCGTGTGSLATAPTDGTANLSSVSALTDQRDGQTYAIAKLSDGNCWMVENLRLETTGTVGNNEVDPTVTNQSLSQGYGASFIGLADSETANFTESTTANSLYYSGTQEGTASINIGTSNRPGTRMPRYNNANTSTRAASLNEANKYSYGNYYTWSAAIADTAFYRTNDLSVTTTSLCPAGWRLPKGGDKYNKASSEFWVLIVDGINGGVNPANYDSVTTPSYNGATEADPVINILRAFPNNFLHSGYYYGSYAAGRGNEGYYWSSTTSSNVFSYYVELNSRDHYLYPGSLIEDKSNGLTVRCVRTSGS